MINVDGIEITDFGYMLLHEIGNKIFYVAYPLKNKYGCMVFIQRGGKGLRHLVYEVEAKYDSATLAVAVAEFDIETIQKKEKKFDIHNWISFFIWIILLKMV